MSFFPLQVMPKSLRKETSDEVDNSPLIYNAKDYNIHHRDIRAIQQTLLGGTEQSSTSGGSTTSQPYGIAQLIGSVGDLMSTIFNGSLLAQFAGTVKAGTQIQLPSQITQASTSGAILASDTTITVESTEGFPDSGTITKFNGLDVQEWCVGGGAPGGGGACLPGEYKFLEYDKFIGGAKQRTFQEVITYTSKTSTQFLNCSRGVNNTTAEDLGVDEVATIVLGNAALCLAPHVWVSDETKAQNQFYITYTPDLTIDAHVMEPGSVTVVKAPVDEVIDVLWSLTVVSYFDLPNVTQTFSPPGAGSNPSPLPGQDPVSSQENNFLVGKMAGTLLSGTAEGYAIVRLGQTPTLSGTKAIISILGTSREFTLNNLGLGTIAESGGQSTLRAYLISSAEKAYGINFDLRLGDLRTVAVPFGLDMDATLTQHISIPVQLSIGGQSFSKHVAIEVSPDSSRSFTGGDR